MICICISYQCNFNRGGKNYASTFHFREMEMEFWEFGNGRMESQFWMKWWELTSSLVREVLLILITAINNTSAKTTNCLTPDSGDT